MCNNHYFSLSFMKISLTITYANDTILILMSLRRAEFCGIFSRVLNPSARIKGNGVIYEILGMVKFQNSD
jgi:hypothetical protein